MASEFAATGRPSTRRFQTLVVGNIGQAESGRGAGGCDVGRGVGSGVEVKRPAVGPGVGRVALEVEFGRGFGFADELGPAAGDDDAKSGGPTAGPRAASSVGVPEADIDDRSPDIGPPAPAPDERFTTSARMTTDVPKPNRVTGRRRRGPWPRSTLQR